MTLIRQLLRSLGCCLLLICCPPPKRQAALAQAFQAMGDAGMLPHGMAECLLAEFDLAPKGMSAAVEKLWPCTDAELGAALRPLYAPYFAEGSSEAAAARL